MVRISISAMTALTVLMAVGCQQNASTPTDGTEAEVPAAGPAVDPGPAPADQWEPSVEDAETPELSTPEPDTSGPLLLPPEGTGEGESTESGEVSLRIQPWDQTEKLITAHRGKVVVVDFWSTSCLPCRREFPHLVKLHNSHQEAVACVSVSLDYSGRASRPPETYRDQVETFLNEQGATFDNVLISDDPDELIARLKLAPIPLVWVYDQQGNLARQFDNTDPDGGEFTYQDDIVPYVESLLASN